MNIDVLTVSALAVVYERVKYRQTGQARIVLKRKNPEEGVNYPFLKTFAHNALMRDIVPSFYFDSMYKDGQKVIPSSPECGHLNEEKTVYWYTQYMKAHNVNKEKLVAHQLEKSKENIDKFIADNGLSENPKGVFEYDLFGRIVFPDFALLVRTGMVSPYLLKLDRRLDAFWNFLPEGIGINDVESGWVRYNADGRLKKLLLALFGNLI